MVTVNYDVKLWEMNKSVAVIFCKPLSLGIGKLESNVFANIGATHVDYSGPQNPDNNLRWCLP